jgi:predicted transcriptional regulator
MIESAEQMRDDKNGPLPIRTQEARSTRIATDGVHTWIYIVYWNSYACMYGYVLFVGICIVCWNMYDCWNWLGLGIYGRHIWMAAENQILTYIQTSIHPSIHTYMHTHPYTHTRTHTHMYRLNTYGWLQRIKDSRTYIHTYIHTYRHTYIHAQHTHKHSYTHTRAHTHMYRLNTYGYNHTAYLIPINNI